MKKLVASTVLALSVIGASVVPAAADNDDIVGGLRLRLAPGWCPMTIAGQRVFYDRKGRVA